MKTLCLILLFGVALLVLWYVAVLCLPFVAAWERVRRRERVPCAQGRGEWPFYPEET